MLIVAWIVVAVLVVVLAVIGFGVLGAAQRLVREVRGLEGQVRPVLAEVQGTLDRAAAQRADGGTTTPR